MSYTNYLIPSGATVTFNSISLGDISDKGAKIRLKEKNIDFGPTQECAGIVKRIPILSSIEAEFEIEDADVDSIGRAFGYNEGISDETMIVDIGQKSAATPSGLVFITQQPAGGYRGISITNMIPSAETLEMILNRKVQVKTPFKFISCGASVLEINDIV